LILAALAALAGFSAAGAVGGEGVNGAKIPGMSFIFLLLLDQFCLFFLKIVDQLLHLLRIGYGRTYLINTAVFNDGPTHFVGSFILHEHNHSSNTL
jgi:hypothetical protein